MVACSAAVVLFLIWRFWQEEEVIPAGQRGLDSVSLEWRCSKGHVFRASGQTGDRACPICAEPAFPFEDYECEVHGTYPVQVRLATDEDGVARPVEFRVPGKKWVPVEEGVHCPRCDREMTRERRDPFSGRSRGRKKTGG